MPSLLRSSRVRGTCTAFVCCLLLDACTLVRIGPEDDRGPSRLQADGLVDGYLAVGIPEEDDLLDLQLFSGRSSGSLLELSVWKLLRVELGLAGASLGVGPLDLGLGVLAYEPESWLEDRSDRAPAARKTPEEPQGPMHEDAEDVRGD